MNENEQISLNSVKMFFPEKQVYECIKCGNCCNNFWEIDIDKVSSQVLKNDENLEKLKSIQKFDTTFSESRIHKDRDCIRTKGGNCVFLDLQKICLIHKHLGYSSKPQRCRDYPFIFVNTPGGVYVSAQYSCHSVLRGKGKHLSEYESQLQQDIKHSEQIYEAKRPVRLSERLEISWEAYLKIEKGLLDFLSVEVYSVDDRLIGGNVFLNLLEEFILEASKDPKNSVELIVETYIENIQKQNYARIIKIAQKPFKSNKLHRMLVSMIIPFRNKINVQYGSFSSLTKVLISHFKSMFKLGKINLLPVESSFRYRNFTDVKFLMEEPYYTYHIINYAKHLIESKQFIIHTSLIKGYNYLLLIMTMLRWYSVGIAMDKSEVDVSRETINTAIEWADRYYGFTSDFFDVVNRYPIIEDTITKVFDRKKYPASIIRGLKY